MTLEHLASAERNIRSLERKNQMGGRFDIEEELKKLTEEHNKKNKK